MSLAWVVVVARRCSFDVLEYTLFNETRLDLFRSTPYRATPNDGYVSSFKPPLSLSGLAEEFTLSAPAPCQIELILLTVDGEYLLVRRLELVVI